MDLVDIFVAGAGGEPLGIGGREEYNDGEFEVDAEGLLLLIGAGGGGIGSAFENLDRPLTFGDGESIPLWPAIVFDQIAAVENSWSTIIADICK